MEDENTQPTDGGETLDYDRQIRLVMGLRMSAFSSRDPSQQQGVLDRLAEEEEKLAAMEAPGGGVKIEESADTAATVGHKMGAATTKLEVSVTVCMDPIPTGIYHLLDPQTEPLVRVKVRNLAQERRRIRVRVGMEHLTPVAAKTIELARTGSAGSDASLSFLPTFLPGVVERMNEVQRVTLYVMSEDLDNKIEAHETYTVVCLSRNSSFNGVLDSTRKKLIDLSHYYGAWVTPYDESVQERIRHAAGLCDPPQIWGYQGKPADVERQVGALFLSLQQHGMKYVNSIIDYGAPAGYFTQRTRLPRESLHLKSANCIDGTVLMASLLEGASLNPAIVLVPGHAFLGWETWEGSGKWKYIETTLMGEDKFENACESGQKTYASYAKKKKAVKLRLTDLRRRGIWPMA